MKIKRSRTFVAVLIVIVTIIFFHYLGWLLPIENFFRKIINPSSKALYSISNSVDEEFSSVEELYSAYTKLKSTEKQAEVAIAKSRLFEKENEQLRQELAFFRGKQFEHVGADVVAKDIDPVASTIIVNRGSSAGIEVGNPAVVYDGIVIGKVIRVENETSVIQLLNDSQSKVAATVLNKDYSIGLIEGGYGISVRMNFIPQNENVAVGDTIVTSGLEDGVPRGLLIGSVQAVEKEAYQPFQRAVITPIVDLNHILTVSIITNSNAS